MDAVRARLTGKSGGLGLVMCFLGPLTQNKSSQSTCRQRRVKRFWQTCSVSGQLPHHMKCHQNKQATFRGNVDGQIWPNPNPPPPHLLSLTAHCDRLCTLYFCPILWLENDSSIQPKNVTHVLWHNINTAEQFKTGGVTDKKRTIGNSFTAPLEALRLFRPTQRVRGGLETCHCLSTGRSRRYPLVHEPHLCQRDKCTKQKNKSDEGVWQMSFLLFKTVSNRAKKQSRGYENIQLSAGDESRLQVHFTGLRGHHGVVQTDPCAGALLLGLLGYT